MANTTNGSSNYTDKVKKNPFPNSHIDPKIKESDDFGKKVGKAIWARFQEKRYNGYYNNIYVNRSYAKGRQDMNQYKNTLNVGLDEPGNGNYLAIDWSISSPGPKFIDVIVGDMINQDFGIQFNAVDPRSKTRKEADRDKLYGNMIRKREMQGVEAETGITFEAKKEGPETEEEIDIHMDMEYKQDVEIAMEEIVDFELYNNDWESTEDRIARDLVENKKGCAVLYMDENLNPRVRYGDIERVIHSHTNQPKHDDVEYAGEYREITVRDLRNLSVGQLTEEDLFHIARKSAGGIKNDRWTWGDSYSEALGRTGSTYLYDDYRVEVLDFVYYTNDVHNYEDKKSKSGKSFFNKKGFNYGNSEASKKRKVTKKIEMEYSGTYIVCYDRVVSYGRTKNILRPKVVGSISPRCIRRYVIFESTTTSLLERMLPHLDQIQLLTLKIRQFIAESVPPGLAIDVNGIVETNFQIEGIDTPMDLIKLYKQKGVMLYDGTDIHGEITNRKTVEHMANGIGDGLLAFYQGIRDEIQAIREETGINEARDATTPDAKALVGIQKLQLINSNNATRELYKAFNHGIFSRVGEGLARMVQDKAYATGSLDQYEAVIGHLGVEALKSIPEEISLAQLGIKVEALPGEVELEQFNADINIALQNGDIALEDSMEIRRIPNVKKGERLLIHRKKKRKEAEMLEFQQKEQITAQREQAAMQAAAEAEKVKKAAETESKVMINNAATENKIKEIKAKEESDARIEHIKGKYELEKIQLASELALDGTEEAPNPKVVPDPDDTFSELTQ